MSHTSKSNIAFAQNEISRVNELIPQQLREDAQNLVSFIEDYYRFLNENGGASHLISELTRNQSILDASDQFLDAICLEIAKGVPAPRAIDKRLLLTKIISFYQTKGSELGVLAFFKIFFDEIVEIYYPKDYLFTLSSGDWNGTFYDDRKGFVSDINRLRDGEYWQEFSYVIRSGISANLWSEYFQKIAHPAGLRFFAALVVELILRNAWIRNISYETEDPDSDFFWLTELKPIYSANEHFIPDFQPGWLSGGRRTLRFTITANEFDSTDANSEAFYRFVYAIVKVFIHEEEFTREKAHHKDILSLKFYDPIEMGDLFPLTLQELDMQWENGARWNRNSFSASIYQFEGLISGLSYIEDTLSEPSESFTLSDVFDDFTSDSSYSPSSVTDF